MHYGKTTQNYEFPPGKNLSSSTLQDSNLGRLVSEPFEQHFGEFFCNQNASDALSA